MRQLFWESRRCWSHVNTNLPTPAALPSLILGLLFTVKLLHTKDLSCKVHSSPHLGLCEHHRYHYRPPIHADISDRLTRAQGLVPSTPDDTAAGSEMPESQ